MSVDQSTKAAGLDVLRAWAAKGRPFSANECRAELRAAGVYPHESGALFVAAVRARILRRVGWEASTDPGTHSKPVARYVAADRPTPLETLIVPARRDVGGRFSSQAQGYDVPLFALESVS